MPRGKVCAPPASVPSKGLTGVCSRCKNSEIGAADKKMRRIVHALDTGRGHAVTIGNIPSLEQFQVDPYGKCRLKQRVGLDIAIEEQAQATGETEIDAAIRRETIRMINKSMPKANAEATVEKLERGEISDDAARELISLCTEQQHDSRA